VKVRYTPQAGRDVAEIYRYIVNDNPAAAGRTLDRIEQLADLLLACRLPAAEAGFPERARWWCPTCRTS
jgi:plasmid stabilization system protein ParE